MSSVPVEGLGVSVVAPPGWDVSLTPNATVGLAGQDVALAILKLSNRALVPGTDTFGAGLVEDLGPGGVYMVLAEYVAPDKATIFTAIQSMPTLKVGSFHPRIMQRTIPGQAGCQLFFSISGRPFCLYAVLGDYGDEVALLPEINAILASIAVSPMAAA